MFYFFYIWKINQDNLKMNFKKLKRQKLVSFTKSMINYDVCCIYDIHNISAYTLSKLRRNFNQIKDEFISLSFTKKFIFKNTFEDKNSIQKGASLCL